MNYWKQIAALCTALGFLCAHAVSAESSSVVQKRPATLVDGLMSEGMGNMALDPSGTWAVIGLQDAAYTSREKSDASWCGAYFFMRVSGADVLHPFSAADVICDSFLSFSPQGTHAAVAIVDKTGRTRLGIYDLAARRMAEFPLTPAHSYPGGSKVAGDFVWLSESEILVNALEQGDAAVMAHMSLRGAANRLNEIWDRAWKGEQASVYVQDSHAKYERHPEEARRGALMRFDARSGAVTKIAEGVYLAMQLSPDGRYLAAARQGQRFWVKLTEQGDPENPLMMTARSDSGGRQYEAVLFDIQHLNDPPLPLAPELMLRLFSGTGSFGWDEKSARLLFFVTEEGGFWRDGEYAIYDVARRQLLRFPQSVTGRANHGPLGNDLNDKMRGIMSRIADLAGGQAMPVPDGMVVFADFGGGARQRKDWYHVTFEGRVTNLTASLPIDEFNSPLLALRDKTLIVSAGGAIWRVPLSGTPRRLAAQVRQKLQPSDLTSTLTDRALQPKALLAQTVEESSEQVPDFYSIDLKSGTATRLAVASGRGQPVAAVTDGSAWILYDTNGSGARLSLQGRESTREVLRLNQGVEALIRPRAVKIEYQIGAEKVSSDLVLPVDYTPGRRIPVILDVYNERPGKWPGSALDGKPSSLLYRTELFASLGYGVLTVNSSHGRAHLPDKPLGNWSGVAEPAMDAVVAAGYADPDRFLAWGYSAGGWTVLALAAQTDRLKAVFAGNSLADLAHAYGGPSLLLERAYPEDVDMNRASVPYEIGYFMLKGPPSKYPQRYRDVSAIYAADRMRAPVLLSHSDFDPFGMDQFESLFGNFLRLNHEAELLLYFGEAHGYLSPANLRDFWSRQIAWFDKWADIARDAHGTMIYEGERVKSRQGKAALTAQEILGWQWFFGPTPAEAKTRLARGESLSPPLQGPIVPCLFKQWTCNLTRGR